MQLWHQGRKHESARKDTIKKGQSGIRATLEEHTQDACVGTQRERRLWEVRDASQRGEGQARTGQLQGSTSTGWQDSRVGSGRISPLGECREGDCRAQGHGWKGGGTENKGEVYRVGTSVFLNRE